MINSITGTIAAIEDGMLYIETDGGIEWAISVSTTTIGLLPVAGSTVRILTYLHHREDQMTLYGFSTVDERMAFLDLMKVGGIGTRQALRILSGMSVDKLIGSLDAEDVDALSRIPGLGKKTAQKMILTLRGKLTRRSQSESEERDEIVDALFEMGFDRGKAKTVVTAIRAEAGTDASEGELLRLSIVRLSSQ